MKRLSCFLTIALVIGASFSVSASDSSPGLKEKLILKDATTMAIAVDAPYVMNETIFVLNVDAPALVEIESAAVITREVKRDFVVCFVPERTGKTHYSPGWLNVTRYTILHVKLKTDKVVHNWIIPYCRDRS